MMTIKVCDNIHFRSFVMAWRDEVEVLEPKTLMNQICEIAESLVDIYHRK